MPRQSSRRNALSSITLSSFGAVYAWWSDWKPRRHEARRALCFKHSRSDSCSSMILTGSSPRSVYLQVQADKCRSHARSMSVGDVVMQTALRKLADEYTAQAEDIESKENQGCHRRRHACLARPSWVPSNLAGAVPSSHRVDAALMIRPQYWHLITCRMGQGLLAIKCQPASTKSA
jgi:hypothetical protein